MNRSIRMEMLERSEGTLPLVHQCQLLDLPRSSVYYRPAMASEEDLHLMALLDKQYLLRPSYGSRRMTLWLRDQGYRVSRKRIQRLMGLMGIEAIYQKPNTSKGEQGSQLWPYLLRGVAVVRSNQVWCADITYIPMPKGFLYLIAVMDWHSRFVLSWQLSNTMDTHFCLEALEGALAFGKPEIFNTDQGSQFTSEPWTRRLLNQGIQISMNGRGRCLDNVFVERLWRSLKYEEVYLKVYMNGLEAQANISEYLHFYNRERRHQSLHYLTPQAVYEAGSVTACLQAQEVLTLN
ncbi:transposase [Gloeobacter kilaueensis JS1]|uniref:Transposase n=2 Tax=Gloeobacter TaxID=33071 RepID=U5QGC3_GLOK1|nr:transposase [Gloeobacter kilaueensis JS1]